MLTIEGCFEKALNSEWPDQALDGRYFRKYISYEDLLFLKNVQNLMEIPSMELKTEKMFFVFKIIGFDYGTANSHSP